jgi:hypothetical protein
MTHEKLIQLLLDAGFKTGWALSGETLVLWEHDVEPPAPLVRPANAPIDSPDNSAE